LVLDENDPHLEKFKELEELDLASIVIMDGVGAEKFAKHAFDTADAIIRANTNNRCFVESVECMEHGANSAIYTRR
jgi:6-pyruvoyltetrahydropterin/6-carboxytetrahydropterin synthase